MVRFLSALAIVWCVATVAAYAESPPRPVDNPVRLGCDLPDTRVAGGEPDGPPILPGSFLRVSNADGSFRELLELPPAEHAFIDTEGLLPAPLADSKGAALPCAIVSFPFPASPTLAGDPCPSFIAPHIDNGPVAHFAGAARGDGAVVRVRVEYNKMFAVGIYDINELVDFSLDGSPELELPARGIEPVYVTARFPNIRPGPHRIAYAVGHEPQGIVCL
jgi:hypothetical protein